MPFYTTDFLRIIDDNSFRRIKHLEISFTIADCEPAVYTQTQITTMWFDKFYQVSNLNFNSIVLDFTNTVNSNDDFLVSAVKSFPTFQHGLPTSFKALASDQSLEDKLVDIFIRKNHLYQCMCYCSVLKFVITYLLNIE